ncbi:MAG: HIT domain-containing protein [Actinomycetota bacterium]|nr:HIT domain-containing protein [Actinomycetota bacterium]
MSLEHLWAGWRDSYVSSTSTGPVLEKGARGSLLPAAAAPADTSEVAGDDCIFCSIASSELPEATTYIVWSSRTVVAVLNAYPYAPGHLLVMPRRHLGELADLDDDESRALWTSVRAAVAAVKSAYAPDGLNIGINLGRAAGAGIPLHLHVHVVPRWNGDTNFMTATAETRVLPEALSVSWQRLRASWAV